MSRIRISRRRPARLTDEASSLSELVEETKRYREMRESFLDKKVPRIDRLLRDIDKLLGQPEGRGERTYLRVTIRHKYLSTSQFREILDGLQAAAQYVLQTELLLRLPKNIQKEDLRVDFIVKDISKGSETKVILAVVFMFITAGVPWADVAKALLVEYIKITISSFRKIFTLRRDERPQNSITEFSRIMDRNCNLQSCTIEEIRRDRAGRIRPGVRAEIIKYHGDLPFVGNIVSKIFHAPDCKTGRKILWNYKEYFDSPEDARRNGFKPHKPCHQKLKKTVVR